MIKKHPRLFSTISALIVIAAVLACAGWRRPIRIHFPGGVSFNFTGGIDPGVTCAHTGGLVYGQNLTGTVVSYGNNVCPFDNNAGRAGLPTWGGPLTNQAPDPFNFSAAGWTNQGGASNVTTNTTGISATYPLLSAVEGGISVVASPWAGFGNAFSFPGAGAPYVQLGQIAPAIGAPFAVELKFERSRTGVNERLFSSAYSGSRSITLNFISSDDHLYAVSFGGGVTIINTAASISAGVLHDAALTYDGATMYLFLDGVLAASSAATLTSPALMEVQVGNDAFTSEGQPFGGIIDEFRYSNVVRYTTNYTPAVAPFAPDANTITLLHMNASSLSFATGAPDPTGGTGATQFLAVGPLVNLVPTALTASGNTDTTPNASSIYLRDDATVPPQSSGVIAAEPFSLGTDPTALSSLLTGSSYRRATALFYKSGSVPSDFQLYPSGATTLVWPPVVVPGNLSTPINPLQAAGGIDIWGAQIVETHSQFSELPLFAGTTSANIVSLNSSLLSQVLQPSGDLYASASYYMDPFGVDGGNTAETHWVFQLQNADGNTGLAWQGVDALENFVNGTPIVTTSFGVQALQWFGVPAIVALENWARPHSTLDAGWDIRYNGCRVFYDNGASAAVIHAPTSVYLGGDGTGSQTTSWDRRWATWSFVKFNENSAYGLISGDSIISAFSTHMATCSYINTTNEYISGKRSTSMAVIGTTIGNVNCNGNFPGQSCQYHDFSVGPYANDASLGAGIKWVVIQILNDTTDFGEPTASANVTGYLALLHSKLPNAQFFLFPTAPCNPPGSTIFCNCADIQNFNNDLIGTGPNPITCPVGATCHSYSYASTWGPAGDFQMDDGTGTCAMKSIYNAAGDQHENDPGAKGMGQEHRAKLQAAGVLL